MLSVAIVIRGGIVCMRIVPKYVLIAGNVHGEKQAVCLSAWLTYWKTWKDQLLRFGDESEHLGFQPSLGI